MFLDRRIAGYQKIMEEEEEEKAGEMEGSELYQVIKNEDSVTFN